MSTAAVPRDMPGSGLQRPELPFASPVGDIACPLGAMAKPNLTTPSWMDAAPGADMTPFEGDRGGYGGGFQPFGVLRGGGGTGFGEMEKWGWEMGSECGSVPSAWSKPSTMHSGRTGMSSGSHASRVSSSTGDGLIPGLVDGQRLSTVKPASMSIGGGKVVVSLRKEIPEGHWDHVEIVLVNGPDQIRLKPTAVKKGKKLCCTVPGNLEAGDYDVRLSLHSKIIHGAIPLAIIDGEASSNEDLSNDEISAAFSNLGRK